MNKKPIYYADYLSLDKILGSQDLLSAKNGKAAHDETLFIVVHQVYELWFKLIIHELDSILEIFKKDSTTEKEIGIIVSRLERITEIQKILIDQLRVLETMTPLDFLDFRDHLIPASGFQSVQFRLLENKLGLKPNQRLTFNHANYKHAYNDEDKKLIENSEKESSLFDCVESWLERTPFLELGNFKFWDLYKDAAFKMYDDDLAIIQNNPVLTEEDKKHQLKILEQTKASFEDLFKNAGNSETGSFSSKAIQAALLINLYRDEPILHIPYKLLRMLLDLDELFTTWRYKHSLVALRMLGTKIGTGGSSGHKYLKATTESYKIFGDLFNLSSFLIPRSKLPELPEEVKTTLDFHFNQSK